MTNTTETKLPEIYCLKCKKKTPTLNAITDVKTTKG